MSTSIPLDETAAAFLAMAEFVYGGETYDGIYQALCKAAVDIIPGCDHAAVTTMKAGERPVCEATTDDVAARIDDLEWETGEGPCLDAILTQRYEWDPDITTNASWPKLAQRVLAETPVRGMLGYRIIVGERKVGALNIFSDTPGALTAESASIGAILAAFASVALSAATAHEAAESLRGALASNREIGKAIGLLMATQGITDEEAFEQLRAASSQMNVRLAVVAKRIVEAHQPEDHPEASSN